MGPGLIYRVNIFGKEPKHVYNQRMKYMILSGRQETGPPHDRSTEDELIHRAKMAGYNTYDVYYNHVAGADLTLGDKVEYFSLRGWEPVGGVTISNKSQFFYQAMVKRCPDPPET